MQGWVYYREKSFIHLISFKFMVSRKGLLNSFWQFREDVFQMYSLNRKEDGVGNI